MESKPLVDVLDQAIARQLAGEPAEAVLADYRDQAVQLWPLLEASAALMTARSVEMPPAADQQSDRAAFLALTTAVALPIRPSPNAPAQRVPTRRDRLVGLFAPLATLVQPQRKEHKRMLTLAVRAALILALFIGSIGGAAVLADESLPGSPAYSIKLMFEQSRLALNGDPAAEAQLYLSMARARVNEMIALANSGTGPPAALIAQLQHQLAQSYHYAAQAPDDSMEGILTQARAMTQDRETALQQVRTQAQGSTQTVLQTAATLLNRARQAAQYGLDDPAGFRRQYAAGPPEDAPFGPFGPRNGDCNGDCEPAGDQHQYGPQPTPPGGPNGDCDGDCEPAGDQHRHGPQPTPPGGPNGDCDADCEPDGDQHQHGPQPTPPADPGGGNGSGGQQSDPPSGDNGGSGSDDNGSDDNGSGNNGSGNNGSGNNGSGNNGSGNNGSDGSAGANPPPAGSDGGSDGGGQGSGSDQGGSGSSGSDQGGGGRK